MEFGPTFLFCSCLDNNDFIRDPQLEYFTSIGNDISGYMRKYFIVFKPDTEISYIYDTYYQKFVLYEIPPEEAKILNVINFEYGLYTRPPVDTLDYRSFSLSFHEFIFNCLPQEFVVFLQNHFPHLSESLSSQELLEAAQRYISEGTSYFEWVASDPLHNILKI